MTRTRKTDWRTPSRRQILAGGLASTLAGGLAGGFLGAGRSQAYGTGVNLVEPAEEVSKGGLLRVDVSARYGTYTLGDQRVTLRGYDGLPVGRTLRVRAGDTLRLSLSNDLPDDPLEYLCTATPVPGENKPRGFNVTNMHVHGVHVSPQSPADNILLLVGSGQRQDYVYEIPADHPPGTYFYHAHFHGSVSLQVASGMAGALIIEGPVDDIPEIKAAREKVMVFQTQRFDARGVCEDYQTLFTGTQVYLNGQVAPIVSMRPGEVQRWRLINASHMEALTLRLVDHAFTALCFDGNPLAKTAETDAVQLVPGNRADILVKAGKPGLYAIDGGEGAGVVGFVSVSGEPTDMALYSGDLPRPAILDDIKESDVTYGRRLEFGMADGPPSPKFTINGKAFTCADPWMIPIGAVEEWEVYNHTADPHPFHIHINPFQVVSGGNVEPGTWLDTMELFPFQRIKFRTRFLDYTGTFVFHCHNLTHEDVGMMQAVQVFDPNTMVPG